MANSPFFTVFIPTRDRSHVIGYAIRSILQQTFTDWEIVIGDNDDSDATSQVVSQFGDPRIRYVRTGGLSMHDNWDATAIQARGAFVLPLADKQALKTRALERIHSLVEREHPVCMRWSCDTLDDTQAVTFLSRAGGDGNHRTIQSDELLTRFTTGRLNEVGRFLPLGHLSGFSGALLREIRNGPAQRLCPPISPDYTLAFQALAYGDGVLHLDQALSVASLQNSTGRSSTLKTAVSRRVANDAGGREKAFDLVPVKALLVRNSVYNDYLRVREVLPGRLADFPLGGTNYFLDCYEDIRTSEKLGVDMTSETAAWRAALDGEPADVRTQVLARTASKPELLRGDWRSAVKSIRRRTGLTRLEWAVKNRIHALTGRKDVGRFANVLDYVQWEHAERGE